MAAFITALLSAWGQVVRGDTCWQLGLYLSQERCWSQPNPPPAKYALCDKVEGNRTNCILEATIWFKVLQLCERRLLRNVKMLSWEFCIQLHRAVSLCSDSTVERACTSSPNCKLVNSKDADFRSPTTTCCVLENPFLLIIFFAHCSLWVFTCWLWGLKILFPPSAISLWHW